MYGVLGADINFAENFITVSQGKINILLLVY